MLCAYPALAKAPGTNEGHETYSQQYVPIVQSLPTPYPRNLYDGYVEHAYVPTDFDPKAYLASITTPQEYEFLSEVIRCESGWKMKWNYMNPSGDPTSRFSAFGYFQIIKSTALATDSTLDRMKAVDNLILGVKLYRRAGLSPWEASRSCWR